MSREQANAYQKHRDANDAAGNMAWAARVQHKALRAGAEALARVDVEGEFELGDDERVLWRLLKLPRKYMELEHSGVLPVDKLRGVLRGLVAADVVDICEQAEAKALIPAEIKRVRGEVTGQAVAKSSKPLKAKVYRPDIGLNPQPQEPAVEVEEVPAPPSSSSARSANAPEAVVLPSGPSRPPTAEEQAFKDLIDKAFLLAKTQTHYEFLGVARPTDDAAVKRAYVALARDYHPDRLGGTPWADDATTRNKIGALFKRLGDANQMLGTAEGRITYDRELEALARGATPAHGVEMPHNSKRRPTEAMNAYRMGDTFFKKKDFKQAEVHFRQACMHDGEDPRFACMLAWCIFLNPDHPEQERAIDAKKRLQELVNVHKHGDAAYKLGVMARMKGDETTALKRIQEAHKLDPAHVEAMREVRLIEQRAKKAADEKADEKGGFLGKLLKK